MDKSSNQTPPESRGSAWRRVLCAAALGAALTLPAVSAAHAQDAFIYIDTAPDHYDRHPHTVYRGEPVYYVDGRWYRQHGRRWAYYRDEPRDLVRYRERRVHRVYEYDAPRGRPHRHHDHDRYDGRREDRRDDRRDDRRVIEYRERR